MTTKTNQKIDFELALAIGYAPNRVHIFKCPFYGDETKVKNLIYPQGGGAPHVGWQRFDHTDPAVIWPIAERFDCFPVAINSQKTAWMAWSGEGETMNIFEADNPATATALAVIEHCKKGK